MCFVCVVDLTRSPFLIGYLYLSGIRVVEDKRLKDMCYDGIGLGCA